MFAHHCCQVWTLLRSVAHQVTRGRGDEPLLGQSVDWHCGSVPAVDFRVGFGNGFLQVEEGSWLP